jgi:hypothetical protein
MKSSRKIPSRKPKRKILTGKRKPQNKETKADRKNMVREAAKAAFLF